MSNPETDYDALHRALTPMADGCAATATLASVMAKDGGYPRHFGEAVQIASQTLAQINRLMDECKVVEHFKTVNAKKNPIPGE